MDISDYARMLRRSWILLLLAAIVGGGGALVVSLAASPRFEASAQMYVSIQTEEGVSVEGVARAQTAARQAVAAFVGAVDSDLVLDRVVQDLSFDTTAEALRREIAITSPVNSVTIAVTASGPDANRAAEIANTVAAVFPAVVDSDLELPGGVSPSLIRIQTTQDARVPSSAVSPNTPLNASLGALVALTLAFAGATFWAARDPRLHSVDEAEGIAHAPVIGAISRSRSADKLSSSTGEQLSDPQGQDYARIRSNLQFAGARSDRSIVVASAGRGGNSTPIAVNIALAAAKSGAKVVVVDADVRDPALADYLGITLTVGLADVLEGRSTLIDVLVYSAARGLHVVPAGVATLDASNSLGSLAMGEFVGELTGQFDVVIVNSAPFSWYPDAGVVAGICGSAVIVAQSNVTRKRDLAIAARVVRDSGADLRGVVITGLPKRGLDSLKYGTRNVFTNAGQGADVRAEPTDKRPTAARGYRRARA